MLYGFSHYATPAGRRVCCMIAAEDYERAKSRVPAGFFEHVSAVIVEWDMVRLVLTVGAAMKLADALAGIGGDAAATARMLSDNLDAMAVEVQPARVLHLTGSRREYSRAAGF